MWRVSSHQRSHRIGSTLPLPTPCQRKRGHRQRPCKNCTRISWVLSRNLALREFDLNFVPERLSKVKPLLDDQQHQNWPLVTQELAQITSLVKSFTEQKPKSSRSSWNHLADSLDQEGSFHRVLLLLNQCANHSQGVNLWNISGLIHKAPDKEGLAHQAARLFLFIRWSLCEI